MKGPSVIVLAAALAFVGHGEAAAQPPPKREGSFSANRFDPAPPGDRFQAVNGAAVEGEELARFALTLEYARDPLAVRAAPLIQNQFVLHTQISLALWERILLSTTFPIVLVSQGESVVVRGPPRSTLVAPNGPSVGDLRVGWRIQALGVKHGRAELALGGDLWVPTGRPTDYSGDPDVRGMPYVVASGKWGPLAYAGQVGVVVQRSQDFVDVHVGPDLRFGLATAFVSSAERFQIGPELVASAPLTRGARGAEALWNAELLGSVRVRAGSALFGGAFGGGLARGIGMPTYRGLLTIAYAPLAEVDTDGDGVADRVDACPLERGSPNSDPELHGCPLDRDDDGIFDAVDACPDEPGIASIDVLMNGCPVDTDRDGDGIPDKLDACPDARGLPNDNSKRNGCPPDRDGDGIVDAEDACPDAPGVENEDPRRRGCPADADRDGVPDATDACPSVAGVANADPLRNGCPVSQRLFEDRIELLRPLGFVPGSALLSRAGEAELREVVKVLKEHPEVTQVVIEGSPGMEALRAAVVGAWLRQHGVAAKRVDVRTVPGTKLRIRVVRGR